MSLHSDWKTAKTDAKARNNGKDVKIEAGSGLGKLLDDWEAKIKAYEKVRGNRTPAEGSAKTQAANATNALSAMLGKYEAWLRSNPIALREVSAEARTILNGKITRMNQQVNSTKIRLGLNR